MKKVAKKTLAKGNSDQVDQEEMFILEPEYQKCVVEVETYRRDSMRIERAIGWRYGQILVGDLTEKEIKDALKDRDDWDRVCVSDKFEFIDRPKQIERARQHFDKKTDDINIYFTEWLKNLRKLKNKYNLEIDVIFFDAYWSYDLDKKANFVSSNLEYNKKLKLIVCSNKQHYSIFKKTLFLQYSKKAKTDNLFTYTLRHFKKHPNQFHNVTEFCAES